MLHSGELIFAVVIVNVPTARLRLFAPLRLRSPVDDTVVITQPRSYPRSIWRRLAIYRCDSLDYERSYRLALGYRHGDRHWIWRRHLGRHHPGRAASQRPVFDGIVCTRSSVLSSLVRQEIDARCVARNRIGVSVLA